MTLKAILLCPLILLHSVVLASIKPHVLPLFVRNPYFSLWTEKGRGEPWAEWPMFWTGRHIGMGVMAHVPSTGITYPLLGRIQDALLPESWFDRYKVQYPNYQGYKLDASATNFTYNVEGVTVTLSFWSPITPEDTLAQSIPGAYLEVIAEGDKDINIYVDINGQWVSGDRGALIQWNYKKNDSLQTWSFKRQEQYLFTEHNDRSEWGKMYFSAPIDKNVYYQAGLSSKLRKRFARTGYVENTQEKKFRGIMDDEPVFAFVKHFPLGSQSRRGKVTKVIKDSVLYTLTYIHDPTVKYASSKGHKEMPPYWSHYFNSAHDLLRWHYQNFERATAQSRAYGDLLTRHATETVSETYAEIVALSARQVLGATVFSGTPENPIIFLKEISSNGNFQTVDVIFPSTPFFLYTNVHWLAYLLEPLLDHQNAGLYPHAYSMHDLGSHFPNATGHPYGRDEKMPVEECGNMLIMGLSYAHALIEEGTKLVNREYGLSNARKWLDKDGRYRLWKQWAGFLEKFGLFPSYQLSTDDFAGRLANQTNLAVKALVGIKAMAEISEIVGKESDARYFNRIADEYMPLWEKAAVSRDASHTKLAYHWYGSWGTLYNLYNDALLCFLQPEPNPKAQLIRRESKEYFSPDIYRMQSRWYSAVMQRYGLPLDVRHFYAKSDWELYAAAIASNRTLQQIVEAVGIWLSETAVNRPFTDLYDTETGRFPGIYFMARPVVGGHFAILALDRACGGEGLKRVQSIFKSDEDEARYTGAIDVGRSLYLDAEAGEVPEHELFTGIIDMKLSDEVRQQVLRGDDSHEDLYEDF